MMMIFFQFDEAPALRPFVSADAVLVGVRVVNRLRLLEDCLQVIAARFQLAHKPLGAIGMKVHARNHEQLVSTLGQLRLANAQVLDLRSVRQTPLPHVFRLDLTRRGKLRCGVDTEKESKPKRLKMICI